ncbi:fatty-acid amide hydrolase 2-A [Drosophila guanche]|uniref:Blast:Fatty-acid amide hydrolase 2-A n=1 Tax=Drosophila guanche TaxID=7266 RepID=A0A3B0JKX7_DROGU|nr:fatty-acid amide hydrolase 2-A [Drosophila guanche]SPP82974.1 blast:Fatty-acid amide hydrolase 2-A [Drosophila guanche]
MELFLRLILIVVKAIALIVGPLLDLFWYPPKVRKTLLPPIRNRLLTLSVQELRNRLRRRQLTSVELVEAYIERIEAVNPHLNALVESRFPAALVEAAAADDLIAGSTDVEKLFRDRPLLGLPLTVKESCALGGMTFAVGSLARRNVKAQDDGVAVKRIRYAGAIPLLVSATPEYCFSVDTDTMLNGRCINPYDFERTPGGSSGGEGSLNGAGASLFGIGSDIGGSIRIPSLYCGIFGHKPSSGVVSVGGHFPNSSAEGFEQYLVEGPMSRFAVDLPDLLEVMAGSEKAAALRLREPFQLSQLKIHYALGFEGINGWMHQSVDGEIQNAIRKAVTHLKTLGLDVQRAKLPDLGNSMEMALVWIANLHQMDYLLEAEPTEGSGKVRETLGEMLRSIRGQSSYTINALIFELLRRCQALMGRPQMEQYLAESKALIGKFSTFLGENGVLLFPTMSSPAGRHKWTVFPLWGIDYTLIFNVLGLPVTHVPIGLNKQGLPIGLSVIAAPHQDRLCLHLAMELERAFGGWQPPTPHEFDD